MKKPVKHTRSVLKRRRPIERRSISLGRSGQIAMYGIAMLVVLGLTTLFTATQFENHNNFCASCHTEYYNQSLASTPVDLASFHELKSASRCIDCHTGQGVRGRVNGLMVGALNLVEYFRGYYHQQAIQDFPISDENCLKCHPDVIQKQGVANHFHVFLAEWQQNDTNAATCVSCHNGHNSKGDAKISYLNKKDTAAICQKCHDILG